jgi:glycosyltransferase involved in cell wall biosynthesis
MKIGYLVSRYPAINHTYLLREVRSLRGLGFDVFVISIAPPDRPPDELTGTEREEAALVRTVKTAPIRTVVGAHLLTLSRHPVGYLRGLAAAIGLGGDLRRLVYNLFYFAEAVVAGRWFEYAKVRHFHVHYASTVGLLMSRVFPLTMSITLHGRSEFVDPVRFRLREKVAASVFVCAISHYARSRVMMACEPALWEKIELARLGVDPGGLTPGEFRAAPDPFEILSVGQLVPIKAHRILLEAVARVARELAGVRLRLVGDGPERKGLEEYAISLGLGDRVRFEGALTFDRVVELYRLADLFVLSSFDEGVPVVLMEAMAMEVPCVATRITGIPELIRDGVDGLLVAPSDVEGLAEAILRLVRDPDLRLRLGKAARQRILECYELGRNTAALAEIFRRRLGSG